MLEGLKFCICPGMYRTYVKLFVLSMHTQLPCWAIGSGWGLKHFHPNVRRFKVLYLSWYVSHISAGLQILSRLVSQSDPWSI